MRVYNVRLTDRDLLRLAETLERDPDMLLAELVRHATWFDGTGDGRPAP